MRLNNENLSGSDWVAGRGAKWSATAFGMESMLMPIDEPLIRALQLDAPYRIAEVGSGGGGTTLEILRRAPAGSVVHGFDISPRLVELARARVQHRDRAIQFEVADMATAAPRDRYERLVSRFGIMFFDDPTVAFENLARWLDCGGRFAFAVWGPPDDNPWMTSVREVVARVVELSQSPPDAPGPFRYASSDKLLSLLERAGLVELEVREWRGALAIGGGLPASEAAQFALSSFSTFGEQLAEKGDAALNDARRSLTTCFSRHEENGAVSMHACVRIVTGRAQSR